MPIFLLPGRQVDLGAELEDEDSEAHEAHAEACKEVEVLKKLSHPCVIAIFGAFVERSTLFILMEYADGHLALTHAHHALCPE
jgi:serine/threonine protein kinase